MIMERAKREALEAAGWVFGDAEDFLGLNANQRAEVEKMCKTTKQDELYYSEPVMKARVERLSYEKEVLEKLNEIGQENVITVNTTVPRWLHWITPSYYEIWYWEEQYD
jgi:hypothetical protein